MMVVRMYVMKACDEWTYGSKPLVSESDIGLGLWCHVVGRVDAGVLKDPGAFIVRVARSEHSQKAWVFSSTAVRNSENSQSAVVLFLKLDNRWKWVATFTLRPPYFAGKNHPVSRPFWTLRRSPQCRREGFTVRKGARGPTVLHVFLSLWVVSLFFVCAE